MSQMGLVSRVTPVHTAKRNCTRDEGGPFEFGDQVLLGFIAEPRSDVGHRPDSGVVIAPLEPDSAERREPCAMPMPKPISWPASRAWL